jgi:ABC-type Na+ transport system ATPase subunit NatA
MNRGQGRLVGLVVLDGWGINPRKDGNAVALARRGKTVILSSHLLSDVEDVCDRVVIYYGGKIQAMGTLTAVELNAVLDTVNASYRFALSAGGDGWG